MTKLLGLLGTIAKWFLGFLALGGVLLALLVAYVFWINRPLHQPPFIARVMVDLIVDDKEVRIERIVECKTVELSRDLFRPGRGATTYITTVGALGQRLPDGGAVMLWTPYNCWQDTYLDEDGEQQQSIRPNSADYLPFLAWTPDVENPATLEIYSSPVILRNSDLRVQVKQVKISDAPKGLAADRRDEFEWFTFQRDRVEPKAGSRWRQIGPFHGYAALVLGEGEWRGRSPALDAELAEMKVPTMISRETLQNGVEARFEAERIFAASFPSEANWQEVFPNQVRRNISGRNAEQPNRGSVVSLSMDRQSWGAGYFPLQMIGNEVEVSSEGRAQPFTLHKLHQSQVEPPNGMTFVRRGIRIEPNPNHPSMYLFDPETREIFFIRPLSYSGQAHPDDEIVTWMDEHVNNPRVADR